MNAASKLPTTKLWIGFAMMGVAALVWVIAIQWAMNSMGTFGSYPPGSQASMDAAMAQMGRPMDMMSKMMVGYAISGIMFIGGMIVTGMGLIEYAAEIWKRG